MTVLLKILILAVNLNYLINVSAQNYLPRSRLITNSPDNSQSRSIDPVRWKWNGREYVRVNGNLMDEIDDEDLSEGSGSYESYDQQIEASGNNELENQSNPESSTEDMTLDLSRLTVEENIVIPEVVKVLENTTNESISSNESAEEVSFLFCHFSTWSHFCSIALPRFNPAQSLYFSFNFGIFVSGFRKTTRKLRYN